MSLLARLFPYDKQWCVVLSLISALSWSFMDVLTGLNRGTVEGATVVFTTGISIVGLGVVAVYIFRTEVRVSHGVYRTASVNVCVNVCVCV